MPDFLLEQLVSRCKIHKIIFPSHMPLCFGHGHQLTELIRSRKSTTVKSLRRITRIMIRFELPRTFTIIYLRHIKYLSLTVLFVLIPDSHAVHRCLLAEQSSGPRNASHGLSSSVPGYFSQNTEFHTARRWAFAIWLQAFHCHNGEYALSILSS